MYIEYYIRTGTFGNVIRFMCCVFVAVRLLLQMFKAVGVRLVVVDIITWTMGDPFQFSSEPGVILDNFRFYSPNFPQKYDSAMLFT